MLFVCVLSLCCHELFSETWGECFVGVLGLLSVAEPCFFSSCVSDEVLFYPCVAPSLRAVCVLKVDEELWLLLAGLPAISFVLPH